MKAMQKAVGSGGGGVDACGVVRGESIRDWRRSEGPRGRPDELGEDVAIVSCLWRLPRTDWVVPLEEADAVACTRIPPSTTTSAGRGGWEPERPCYAEF